MSLEFSNQDLLVAFEVGSFYLSLIQVFSSKTRNELALKSFAGSLAHITVFNKCYLSSLHTVNIMATMDVTD